MQNDIRFHSKAVGFAALTLTLFLFSFLSSQEQADDEMKGLEIETAVVLSTGALPGAGDAVTYEATMAQIDGVALVGKEELKEAELYQGVADKEKVKVEGDSEAEIVFDDGNAVLLEEGIIVVGKGVVQLTEGKAVFNVVKGNYFQVDSPVSIIGVRGTEFVVEHTKDNSKVSVIQGAVEVENPEFKGKKIRLKKGKTATIARGFKPSRPAGISEEFLEEWQDKLDGFRKRVGKQRAEMHKLLSRRVAVMSEKKKGIADKLRGRQEDFRKDWKK
ncbi:MAG TPA: FecR family protein [bacterium]|nr:FecR family protein [bacterium]